MTRYCVGSKNDYSVFEWNDIDLVQKIFVSFKWKVSQVDSNDTFRVFEWKYAEIGSNDDTSFLNERFSN
jgi:hypothetical protein